jgi:hypothetical protein
MDSTMSTQTNRNFWKKEEENLLKQWADKAQCYQWMHSRSHDIYSRKNALFTIPVIIISTITGTANFAQERFEDDIRTYVVISIGTLSIIAGIITTIYQFLKIAELNEGHRVSSLSWGKFYRNIKTELTRHPIDRMPPLEMIKISRDEYDRLVELSPFMPMAVIKEFNSKFNKNKHIDLTKPEICDELASTVVFQLTDEERLKLMNQNNKKKDENPKETKRKAIIQKKVDTKIEKFKQTFYSLNNRYPTADEISKNMSKFVDAIPEEEITDDNNIECNEIVIDESNPESDTEIKETIIDVAYSNQAEVSAKIMLDIDNTVESTTDDVDDDNDNDNDGDNSDPSRNKKIV